MQSDVQVLKRRTSVRLYETYNIFLKNKKNIVKARPQGLIYGPHHPHLKTKKNSCKKKCLIAGVLRKFLTKDSVRLRSLRELRRGLTKDSVRLRSLRELRRDLFFCKQKKRLATRYFPTLLNVVSSPQRTLTAVFGMETGVTSSRESPAKNKKQLQRFVLRRISFIKINRLLSF